MIHLFWKTPKEISEEISAKVNDHRGEQKTKEVRSLSVYLQ